MYVHEHYPGFHTEWGAPWDFPPPPQNYDIIALKEALKEQKVAVILYTSDGNLGAVS